MTVHYQFINTRPKLEAAVSAIEKAGTLAVDLEADSMYHYHEKICLIQLAANGDNYVIDPLEVKDLSMMAPLFSRPSLKKVFHGADYDIRSLYRDFKIEINNLFDTQLACRFLGAKETGLDAVLLERFNVRLNKKYQKKDWSKRPLPQAMLDYAVQDVTYLIPLAKRLEKELAEKKRRSWVTEECDTLSRVRPMPLNDNPLFLKCKGAGRLRSRGLCVLEALLQFREAVARQKDRPLFKILGNESLMKIAAARPRSLRRLKKIEAISDKQLGMYGEALVETVRRAVNVPLEKCPVYPRKKAPSLPAQAPIRMKALKSWRDSKAKTLALDPALVCTRATMLAIARANPKHKRGLEQIKEIKNWQREAFGTEIIAALKT